MTYGKTYKITKRRKLHTKPLVEAEITNESVFLKETEKSYIFVGFQVRKSTVVKVEEVKEV